MKFIHRLNIFILLVSLFAVSCSREDMDEIIADDPVYVPDTIVVNNLMSNLKSNSSDGMDLGCFTIQFPFELLTESGASVTISSEDAFFDALEMDSTELVIDFVYPINITSNDGVNSQIDNANTLGILFASCIPENGWTESADELSIIPASLYNDLCFDIIYPVELLDSNGNTNIVIDEDEFIDLLAEAGPLYFVLPVNFEDEDGNAVVVDDFDSFFELAFECEDIHAPAAGDDLELDDFDCFELVYPYDVELEDGSIITVTNEDDYAQLVLNGQIGNIVFPFSIQDSMGNTSVINTVDDLIPALIDCGLIIITEPDSCSTEAHVLLFYNALNIFTLNKYPYDITYPVTLIVDGNPVVINNGDDYLPAVGGNPSRIIPADIVYPVTVTQFGRDIVLNSDDDVCAFYFTLSEACENKPAHIQFFFNEGGGVPISCAYYINYPLEILRNGVSIQIQNRDEYITELNTVNGYNEIELVYPVIANKFINGQQLDFASDDEICEYLDSCY